MVGVATFRERLAAHAEGANRRAFYRKVGGPTWVAGYWADYAGLPGNPSPFYYYGAEFEFAAVSKANGGINHGGGVAPAKKHLSSLWWFSVGAGSVSGFLVDVLGYYPLIPMGEPGETFNLINFVDKPARWGNGEGVAAYLVSVAPGALVAGNTVTVGYTNSKGVAGREMAPTALQNVVNVNGVLLNAAGSGIAVGAVPCVGPFLGLQGGDDGIAQLDTVRLDGPGDGGLFSIILCRFVADLPSFPGYAAGDFSGKATPTEGEWGRTCPDMPVVDDDAFLSPLLCPQSTALPTVVGRASFFWR